MFIDQKQIELCVERLAAFQSPWGEWLSTADEVRRHSRVRRVETTERPKGAAVSAVFPKPNGFRTLLAVEAMWQILEGDAIAITQPASDWFESSIDGLWFQFRKISEADQVPSESVRGMRQVDSDADVRHTAQALTLTHKYANGGKSHVDTLQAILDQQQPDGSWPFKLGKMGSGTAFSSMSCLELVHSVLFHNGSLTRWCKRDPHLTEKLRTCHTLGVEYFGLNLLSNSEMEAVFDVGCLWLRLNLILSATLSELAVKVKRYLYDKRQADGSWPCRKDKDDPIELHALVYATLAGCVDIRNEHEVEALKCLADFLDTSLDANCDATTYLFSIMGHNALCTATGRELPVMSWGDIKESHGCRSLQEYVYLYDLICRLKCLRQLLGDYVRSELWKKAIEDHRIQACGLVAFLLGGRTASEYRSALQELALSLAAERWGKSEQGVLAEELDSMIRDLDAGLGNSRQSDLIKIRSIGESRRETSGQEHGKEDGSVVCTRKQNAPATILLCTATDTEDDVVARMTDSAGLQRRPETGKKGTYTSLGCIGNCDVYWVRSGMGSAGSGGSALTVSGAIDDLQPDYVVACGVAFGRGDEQQIIGDVLVSEWVRAYEKGRVETDRFIPRGPRTESDARLLQACRAVRLDRSDLRVAVGGLLSGEKLIDDPEFKQLVLGVEPEAIGGEMEGAGIVDAAQRERGMRVRS